MPGIPNIHNLEVSKTIRGKLMYSLNCQNKNYVSKLGINKFFSSNDVYLEKGNVYSRAIYHLQNLFMFHTFWFGSFEFCSLKLPRDNLDISQETIIFPFHDHLLPSTVFFYLFFLSIWVFSASCRAEEGTIFYQKYQPRLILQDLVFLLLAL